MDDWKYIYVEDGELQNSTQTAPQVNPALALKSQGIADPNAGFVKKRNADWEPHVYFPQPRPQPQQQAVEQKAHYPAYPHQTRTASIVGQFGVRPWVVCMGNRQVNV